MIDKFQLFITEVGSVSNYHHRQITDIISIGDRGTKKPYIDHFPVKPSVFRFEFTDTSSPLDPYAPSETQIQYLISVADIMKSKLESGSAVNLLAHCQAGVSRSTAAAYIVLNVFLGPGSEQQCLNLVFAAQPQMKPNERMVSIADSLLNRGGVMFKWVHQYNKVTYPDSPSLYI